MRGSLARHVIGGAEVGEHLVAGHRLVPFEAV
jgi:hypothetical protein